MDERAGERWHRFIWRAADTGFAPAAVPLAQAERAVQLLFRAGGDQSVRGYGYRELGVRENGAIVGGKYMLTASAEYQYSLTDKWRLATFIDQGNSFNSLDIPTLKTGVGFGVRWVSPVGPLRLDLAHALDDDGGVRLQFSMGPEL